MGRSPDVSGDLSLSRIALRALGLLLVIPYLTIAFIFWDDLKDKIVPLSILFVISALGFYLFWTIIHSITRVLRGLERVSRGEAESVDIGHAPSQLREMTEIINALNRLTVDFRENAAQLERFITQFATLTELTEITARIPDIGELLGLVIRKAMSSTQATSGTIMLLREDGERFDIVAAEGWQPTRTGPILRHETLCGKVIETGEPMLVADIREHPEFGRLENGDRYDSPSFLIMPLKTKTATIGAVCLSDKAVGGAFSSQDRQFLTVLLGQIGYAVENARLLNQARESAARLTETVYHKQQQLEEAHLQILQSEKLSALGEMIAGVAHEINNPLASVYGYAELLAHMDETRVPDEKVRRFLTVIHQEAGRATKIVQNLLSFARKKKPEKRRANLNEIGRKILDLRLYDLQTRGIEVETDFDESIPATMLDEDQIQQVVLNLINNAVQALSADRPRRIRMGTGRAGNYLCLWVSDTGSGIPAEFQNRIFDPFFTTKGERSNSGLGLSISYGIIREHGGHIDVDSREGRGTTMTLRLPLSGEPADRPLPPQSAHLAQDSLKGRVACVVDDEAYVADLIADILEGEGCGVRRFNNAREALAAIHEQRFDLILCDVRMPGMDGRDLYRAVAETREDLKRCFILLSGDIAAPETLQFSTENKVQMVAKPFTQSDLLKAVRRVMEHAPAPSP